jgi:hypothetical protein
MKVSSTRPKRVANLDSDHFKSAASLFKWTANLAPGFLKHECAIVEGKEAWLQYRGQGVKTSGREMLDQNETCQLNYFSRWHHG